MARQRYQLTAEALNVINTPMCRYDLMALMNVTEFTVSRYIQKNSELLTLWTVVKYVSKIMNKRAFEVVELVDRTD
jgi:hypothetical protein